jgi:hypothetical protein
MMINSGLYNDNSHLKIKLRLLPLPYKGIERVYSHPTYLMEIVLFLYNTIANALTQAFRKTYAIIQISPSTAFNE